MIFLVDTDTLIHLMRGLRIVVANDDRQRDRQARAERIVALARSCKNRGDSVGLSAITVAELEFGARHNDDYEREMEVVRRVLTPFILFDFDAVHCAFHYGRIRHELQKTGRLIGNMDLLIAAQALALGATIVTGNFAEFSRVPGLNCENWLDRPA